MAQASRVAILASALAAVLSLAGLITAPAQANGCITSGTGTAQDPFIIATHVNLDCLRTNTLDYWNHGYHFKQTADIDMSTYLWTTAIGDDTIPFRGTYDGNGYTISGLTITSTGNDVGVFGVAYDDTLIGITLTGLSVTGNQRVGGLVGKKEGGVIEDVSVTGTVTGASAVGGLIGQVDDSADTTIRTSFTAGSVAVTGFGEHTGGLVGNAHPYSRTLSITDSYSAMAVTGYTKVGGLVGTYVDEAVSEHLAIADSYARGAVSGSFDTGGLIGCLYDYVMTYQCDPSLTGTVTVTDSYWDTQTTGRATTAGSLGTGQTTAQMTTLGTFGNWSITDTTTNQTTWGICTGIESGYPFLQWFAAQEGLTCSQPSPPAPVPAPTPASAPRDVVATAMDRAASVTWIAPGSSGSYPVSTYLVTSAPGGRTCLAVTLNCEIAGLTNGTAYTFTVAALTGAGWGPASDPSNAVTPTALSRPSILITGSRDTADPRVVRVSGETEGLVGEQLLPWTRQAGQSEFTTGSGLRTVAADGTFTWSRRSGKALSVYFTHEQIRSNVVRLPAR